MPTATKPDRLDMKKRLKPLYAPPTHPVLVEVPPLRYLMIGGALSEASAGFGVDPGFRDAIGSLYAVSYTLKFDAKASGGDFVVMPLEGLFWTQGLEVLSRGEARPMRWTLMILQPPWITGSGLTETVGRLVANGKLHRPPALRLETLAEGQAAQILHVGPYAEEPPTIEKLHAFIEEQDLVPRSKHHEIYLSDPNRTPPERLKTVIRQPVRTRSG